MIARAVIALAISAAPAASAAVEVCLHDEANLPTIARWQVQAELVRLFPPGTIEVLDGDCARDDSAVAIRILDRRPGLPPDVLGAAKISGGRIEPRLEIFVAPVAELTGTRSLEGLGRALGRVAAHEIVHYLSQTVHHGGAGVFQECLRAETLLTTNRAPLLISRPELERR